MYSLLLKRIDWLHARFFFPHHDASATPTTTPLDYAATTLGRHTRLWPQPHNDLHIYYIWRIPRSASVSRGIKLVELLFLEIKWKLNHVRLPSYL